MFLFATSCWAAQALGASSGVIARAQLSADGKLASIAGSVHWTDCELPSGGKTWPGPGEAFPPDGSTIWDTGSCRFTPFAFIGQGSDEADCESFSLYTGMLSSRASVVWTGKRAGPQKCRASTWLMSPLM
jgi:hypothetical protein